MQKQIWMSQVVVEIQKEDFYREDVDENTR